MLVSIILPCYKGGHLVRSAIEQIAESLSQELMDFEIIVVDDGGHDVPSDIEGIAPNTRVLTLPNNRGKGAAVRIGMRAATGDVRIFTDVDLPYGARQIPVVARFIREFSYHAVIGDRTLPSSLYADELGVGRKVASAVFSSVVGRLVTGGFFDTQCGLKGFRGDVAEALFDLARVDRFAFDVELVYVCLKHKLDIKRIPVQLASNDTSTIRLLRDSAVGLADVIRIKVNQLRGRYGSTALRTIVLEDFRKVAERRD
jgi:glycosyltransferase involved in cell wall biosynthesis